MRLDPEQIGTAVSLGVAILEDAAATAVAAFGASERLVLVFEFDASRGASGFEEARVGTITEVRDVLTDELAEAEGYEVSSLPRSLRVDTVWRTREILPVGAWDAVASDPTGDLEFSLLPPNATWGEFVLAEAFSAYNGRTATVPAGTPGAPGLVAAVPVVTDRAIDRARDIIRVSLDDARAIDIGITALPLADAPPASPSPGPELGAGAQDAEVDSAAIAAAIEERLPAFAREFGRDERYVVAVPIAAPGTPDPADDPARVGRLRGEASYEWERMVNDDEGVSYFDFSVVLDRPKGAQNWLSEEQWGAVASGPRAHGRLDGLPDGATWGEVLVVEACRRINAALDERGEASGLVAVLPVSLTGDPGDFDLVRAALSVRQRRVLRI